MEETYETQYEQANAGAPDLTPDDAENLDAEHRETERLDGGTVIDPDETVDPDGCL